MKNIMILFMTAPLLILSNGSMFLQGTSSFLNWFYDKQANQFTYDSAKQESIKYLKENQEELEKIAKELYKSKASKNDPYKKISFASYHDSNSSFEKSSYVTFDFDMEGQGVLGLGGQYYGLIYSKDTDLYAGKDLFIYDEKKETGEGNNIFIREKIDKNWYYYYDDYDGKVQIEERNNR